MSRLSHPDEGLRDLFYFAKNVCGFKDLSEGLHREILFKIQQNIVLHKRNTAIIIPRDHFKSSMSLAAVLWLFTRQAVGSDAHPPNYEFRILIDTATLGLGKKHIRWIKAIMRSKKYSERYGDFIKGSRNADAREFYINKRQDGGIHKEPNFMASAIGAETTGNHFDFIWCDDLVSEQNYRTKAQRNKVVEHYTSTTNLLEPEGVILYNGTPWHDADLTGYLRKLESEYEAMGKEKNFEFFLRGVYGDPGAQDGEPIFPERWSKAALVDKRQKTSSRNWACQWICDPVLPEESIPFNKETMYHPRDRFPPLRMRIVTVDPNFRDGEKKSGDFGVFTIGGFDKFMDWWGIDIQMGKYTASTFISKLFEINNMWRPHLFRIEKKWVSFLDFSIRNEMMTRGINLPIEYIPRDNRSKETRYACLHPMFNASRMHFAHEITEDVKLELHEELERAGSSAHDDILDTLADQIEGINPVAQDTFHGEQEATLDGSRKREWGSMMLPAEDGLDEIFEETVN